MSTAEANTPQASGPNRSTRIAVLGTGKMGSAIADRLAAGGFELTLWDRTRTRAEALGIGSVADTPAAAVRGVDVVISSLTGPEAVRATYLGPDGALREGTAKLFIEMSTAGPDLLPSLAIEVATAGGRLVDAPIVGTPPAMRAGQTAILVGGDDRDVDLAETVLSALGTVRRVGPLGNGLLSSWRPRSCRSRASEPACNPTTSSGSSRAWRRCSMRAATASSRIARSRRCSRFVTCARTSTWPSTCSLGRTPRCPSRSRPAAS
jgi:hypothetical protein